MKMNSDYFVTLAKTFEDKYGVEFQGIRNGAVTDPKERLVQFKTNMDVAISVLEKNGLGDWLADRIVEIGDQVKDDFKLSIDVKTGSVPRRAASRGESAGDTQTIKLNNPCRARKRKSRSRSSARPASRRSAARDFRSHQVVQLRDRRTRGDHCRRLSESVNMEHGSLSAATIPRRSRWHALKAAIQEAGKRQHPSGSSGRARLSIPRVSPECGRGAARTERSLL